MLYDIVLYSGVLFGPSAYREANGRLGPEDQLEHTGSFSATLCE